MSNEKNVVTDFLGEVSPSNDIFKEESAKEPEVEEKEEKPLPFHKDPKIQRYIERQIEKAVKDRPSVEQSFKQEVKEVNLPDSLVRLIGNDTPEKVQTLKDFNSYLQSLKGEAKKEAIEDLAHQQQEAEQIRARADAKAQEDLDNYFEKIEETYNVDLLSNSSSAKAMRSQFIDYVRKIAPKNEEGEIVGFPDLVSAFDEFQDRNKRSAPTRAKELASRGVTRSSETTQGVERPKSWNDFDKFISSLKKKN